MVSIETLQMINADLDAERDERLQIVRNANRGASLRNDFVEVEYMEDLRSSTSTVATLTEESDEPEDSSKTKAEDTEHIQLFERMVERCSLLGKFLGIDIVFNWRWERKVVYWITIFALFCVWGCMTYTAYIHFNNGDYVRIMEPLVISGLAISCAQKMHNHVRYWNRTMALLFHLRSVCRRTAEGSSRGNILKNGFTRNLRFMKLYSVGIILAIGFYLVVPIKVYYVDKELISLIPMEVLFCDQSTTSGFIVANIIQAIMGGYAASYTMLYGLTFIVLIFNYDIGADLLAEDFRDLDKMWTRKSKISVAYKHAFLRNICMKRQDMNNYLDTVKEIYAAKFFYYFCYSYFSQIISMYQTTINNWQGGYGAFLGQFFEMMFYCFMGNDLMVFVTDPSLKLFLSLRPRSGTQVTIADDKLCFAIYHSNWYDYDLKSQGMIRLLLKEAQKPKEIRMGVIGPLNLVTFISIVKSIYTYYTVLSELL